MCSVVMGCEEYRQYLLSNLDLTLSSDKTFLYHKPFYLTKPLSDKTFSSDETYLIKPLSDETLIWQNLSIWQTLLSDKTILNNKVFFIWQSLLTDKAFNLANIFIWQILCSVGMGREKYRQYLLSIWITLVLCYLSSNTGASLEQW